MPSNKHIAVRTQGGSAHVFPTEMRVDGNIYHYSGKESYPGGVMLATYIFAGVDREDWPLPTSTVVTMTFKNKDSTMNPSQLAQLCARLTEAFGETYDLPFGSAILDYSVLDDQWSVIVLLQPR